MKRLLSIFFFLLFLGISGLAAGIYFKVLPADFVQKLPFISQYVSTQDSGSDSSSIAQQAAAAQQLPANADNSTNAQTVTPQNGVAVPPANISSAVNSNSPNNKNRTNSNLSKVSRIYSGMKPEEAAAILKDLDDATAVTVLLKMDEDQAAKVLALMDAKRAAVLSNMLLKDQVGVNSNNN